MTALIDLHFLPCIEYFCALEPFERVMLEQHEYYVKQSFRSRCYINTSQGTQMLSVPLKVKSGKVPVSEVRIDYSQNWQKHHWKTIESAYRKAPFFEHYETGLKELIFANYDGLVGLNQALLSFCLTSLGWEKPLHTTLTYMEEISLDMKDLRSAITPKKPFTERAFYVPRPYYQIFGSLFVTNLSIVDLLFCEGPGSASVIKSSKRS